MCCRCMCRCLTYCGATAAVVAMAAVIVGNLWPMSPTNYWDKKKVTTVPEWMPVLGHVTELVYPRWHFFDEVYHEDCSDYCGLFGIYQQPMLMLKDLPLVKNVLESGTHHFIDRYSGMAQKTRDRVFSRGLTQLMGAEWKANRDMISPAFTKEVSKTFYKMMEGDAEKLLSYVADRLRASRTSKLNIKEILSYYLLHVLTSTVFGSKPMSFDIQDVNIALQDLASVSYETLYRRIMYIIAPRLCSILRLKYSTLSYERLEAMAQKAVHDRLNSKHKLHIIDHFMGLVGNETSGFLLEEETAVAAALAFAEMGYERVVNTITFAIHQLAENPSLQDKVREELRILKGSQRRLSYEILVKAEWLHAVVLETLRKYPQKADMELRCIKDYKLPGTPITVEEGTLVIIPTWSIHHDPRYWRSPDEFSPQRFMPDYKEKIISGTFLPFGFGPRDCIGKHFAMMEIKLALAKLLLEYRISEPISKEKQDLYSFTDFKPNEFLMYTFTHMRRNKRTIIPK